MILFILGDSVLAFLSLFDDIKAMAHSVPALNGVVVNLLVGIGGHK